MSALMINPASILPSLPSFKNPSRRKKGRKKGRKKNPNVDQYTKAAGKVFIPPLAFATGGALVGLVVASVAKPERLRYAAGVGAIIGLGVMGALATDALAHTRSYSRA